MYTIVFVDFFRDIIIFIVMRKECKKCKVVHNSLAKRCFSCGSSLEKPKVQNLVFGPSTLLATTILSLSVVMLNINTLMGG